MAIETHGSLPGTITAGDTLLITETLSSYSAASWTLHYVLSGGGNVYRLKSTASGTDHAFTESAAVTGNWKPGTYAFQKFVDDTTGQRKTLARGAIQIEPNIAEADPDVDLWRKIHKGAKEAILQLAKNRVSSYSITGTNFTLTSVDEAIRLERVAKKEVQDLERAARMSAGLDNRRKIQFRI